MIRIVVYGCCGRMGGRIIDLAQRSPGCRVVAGLERPGHPACGTQVQGVSVTDDAAVLANADVAVDFTAPAATLALLPKAQQYRIALVIGTTGMEKDQVAKIEVASQMVPVVYSPNMSVGVNVLFGLVQGAAAKLAGYQVRIREAHHIHKKDAPSGTAKRLAQIIEDQTRQPVNDIDAVREGEIIGDHEVIFESDVDTLTLRHSAKTRDIFVKGAVAAALWVVGKPAGMYGMSDVLGRG